MKILINLAIAALTILITGIGLGVALYLLPFLIPFIIALVLAVLIEPINLFLIRWIKVNRGIAVGISNTLFLLLLFGSLALVGTKIVLELVALFQHLPEFFQVVEKDTLALVQDLKNVYFGLHPDVIRAINDSFKDLFSWGQAFLGTIASLLIGLLSSLPGILIIGLMIFISFVLMSYQLPRLKESFLNLFTTQAQIKVNRVLNDLNSALIGFVRAHFILSSLTYFITLIGLLILGINYALAIALIIIIVDLLPILGTGSVIVPWAIYLFYHGDHFTAIGLLVLYLVITVVRRIIEPKILGQNIGLSPLATIISLFLGLQILGVWGIFIGPILFIIVNSIRRAGLLQFKINF